MTETQTSRAKVTVAICTYQRPMVVQCAETVCAQDCLDEHDVKIVVIDNDTTPSAKALIEDVSKRTGREIIYVHAPEKNISIARNAALAAAVDSDWLAFIDDDEYAPPNWLRVLLDHREGMQVVVGQCKSVYRADFPSWCAICDFHSHNLEGRDLVNAYTANVLLDMNYIRSHNFSFRLELGQTGGEDTYLFHEIKRAGGAFVYRPDSEVSETIETHRATFAWVRRRRFRSGQTHGMIVDSFYPKERKVLPLTAALKSALSFGMAGVYFWNTPKRLSWLGRAYLHLGALNYCINRQVLKEYG